MGNTPPTIPPPPHVAPAPALEPGAVGSVQTESACEGCGYNLRHQGIHPEPQTQLLVVRCPECGRLTPAAELSPRNYRRNWGVSTVVRVIVEWPIVFNWLAFSFIVLGAGLGILHDRGYAITEAKAYGVFAWWGYYLYLAVVLLWTAMGAGMFYRTALRFVVAPLPVVLPWIVLIVVSLLDLRERTFLGPIALQTGPIVMAALVGIWQSRRLWRLGLRVALPPETRMILQDFWRVDRLCPPGIKEHRR